MSRFLVAIVLLAQAGWAQTPPGHSIDGEVVDAATGHGIPGARVRLQAGQEDPLLATTDKLGHFRFSGLESKPYQMQARYPGFMGSQESASAHMRLEMHRVAAIVGKVTDALGVPLEGIIVTAMQRDTSGQRRGVTRLDDGYSYFTAQIAWTNDLGEYRIAPLAAGSYYVQVRPGSNYFSGQPEMRPPSDAHESATFYPSGLKASQAKLLDLAEGKEVRADVRIIRQSGVKVSGRVAGLAAAPVRGSFATVHLWSLSGDSAGLADVIDGRFLLWNVVPGRYVLEGSQSDAGEPADQNVMAAAHRTVEVGTADLDGIDLTLAATPSVEVEVAFESGCAAVPVIIQAQTDLHFVRNLRVGSDGRLVWRHAVPGKYKVYVRPEDASRVFATSARLGDREVLTDGFELTAETRGPLRIGMNCARR